MDTVEQIQQQANRASIAAHALQNLVNQSTGSELPYLKQALETAQRDAAHWQRKLAQMVAK